VRKSQAAEPGIQFSPIVAAATFDDSESVPRGVALPEIEENEMMESSSSQFQLCFRSLFDSGRGYAFPCDGQGQVDLDRMSERARNNYFYARAMVGRELACPAVETMTLQ
jgi:hypothetical protein